MITTPTNANVNQSLYSKWKTLDRSPFLLSAWAFTLRLMSLPDFSVGLWLIGDQFTPRNEPWKPKEKPVSRLPSIHTLNNIYTAPLNLNLLSGPQGRLIPTIITMQRNAFVHWIINKAICGAFTSNSITPINGEVIWQSGEIQEILFYRSDSCDKYLQ